MPSQTILIRAHARTIHTRPVTFICAQCHTPTTRECYPGKTPQYCLQCRPRKKKSPHTRPEKGMFIPTHYLVAPNGRKTEVCLEKTSNPGWYWVRTALDWFSGSSIIQYHQEKGMISHDTPLEGYTLAPLPEDLQTQPQPSASKAKSKAKTKKKKTSVVREVVKLENRPYSGRQLMKRLKCGDRLLRIKRSQADFAEWSQQRDPEGIAWKYQEGQFFPLEDYNLDSSPADEPSQSLPSSSKASFPAKQKKTKKTRKTASSQVVKLENRPYSGRQLMKRLRCGERLLRIKRSQTDFAEWSKQRDPEDIAWQYQNNQFIPQIQ